MSSGVRASRLPSGRRRFGLPDMGALKLSGTGSVVGFEIAHGDEGLGPRREIVGDAPFDRLPATTIGADHCHAVDAAAAVEADLARIPRAKPAKGPDDETEDELFEPPFPVIAGNQRGSPGKQQPGGKQR